MRDHVVLCGSDGLAVRVLEELRALGTDVIVVAADPGHRLEQRARDLDTPLIEGDFRDEDALREADAADAEAVAVLEDDDVGNLHAALAVQEINPDVRLVVRMFNLELGHRLEALFHDGEVLSASVLAAPALADAALEGNVTRPVRVRDRLLEVRAATDGGRRRLGVDVRESEEAPEPVTDAMSRQAASLARRWRARLRGVLRLFDARLAALLGTLAVLLAISAEVFHNAGDLSWMNSLYFTVTTITTTGYGDINLLNADDGVKLYGMALMLLGDSRSRSCSRSSPTRSSRPGSPARWASCRGRAAGTPSCAGWATSASGPSSGSSPPACPAWRSSGARTARSWTRRDDSGCPCLWTTPAAWRRSHRCDCPPLAPCSR